MSNIPSEKSEMSVSEEASSLLRHLAEPAPAGAHIEILIRKAARKLGWSHTRTRDCWYMQAREIRAEEMDALRAAAREKPAPISKEEVNARERWNDLAEHVKQLERQLAELEAAIARARHLREGRADPV